MTTTDYIYNHLQVFPNWRVSDVLIRVDYQLGTLQQFEAHPIEMAEYLTRQKMIVEVVVADGVVWVTPDEEEMIMVRLVDYVATWTQRNWIDFLITYELKKLWKGECQEVKDKYSVANELIAKALRP